MDTKQRMSTSKSVYVAQPGMARLVKSFTPTTQIAKQPPKQSVTVKTMSARMAMRSRNGISILIPCIMSFTLLMRDSPAYRTPRSHGTNKSPLPSPRKLEE